MAESRPERLLAAELRQRGLMHERNVIPLPASRREVDIAFPQEKVAVFVDGCHWHGCDVHWRPPRLNAGYWTDRIISTQVRDVDTDERLRRAGWVTVRVWEHESSADAADRVEEVLRARRHRS